jgi:hypothetical protein
MKYAADVLLVCLAAALFLAGCNYAKPMMYVQIANRSGHPMENLEVKHPTGSLGIPELRNEQTRREMLPFGTPCNFSVTFQDQTGKTYFGKFDLGAKCPTEVAFDVGAGMSITERLVRP